MNRRISSLVLFLALAGPSLAAAATATQVVLALDASRSLSGAENRAATTLARDLATRLPQDAQLGIVTFDDAVRWLASPGAAGDGAALGTIAPTGRFTVLNDALVEGIRALPDGGVIVLLSDGRDENSATTLEDVARLAGAQGVRVVTIGAGRPDERTLRRLALLTGGLYAGPVASVEPEALAREIESAREALAREREAKTPPPAPPPVAPVATPPQAPPPEPSGLDARWLLALGGLLAAAGILTGFLLARRRPSRRTADAEPTEPDRGTAPGTSWPEPAVPQASSAAAHAPVDELLVARVRLRQAAPPRALEEVSLDETASLKRLTFAEAIERTLVLTEEIVLVVHEPGVPTRSYRLPASRAVDVGRDSSRNTLAFLDPTLSLQHLRLALEEGEVLLLDLGSTNGVFVGERRVDAARLRPGDHFRAGMIDFELRLHQARQN